jgi:hypothetical protein
MRRKNNLADDNLANHVVSKRQIRRPANTEEDRLLVAPFKEDHAILKLNFRAEEITPERVCAVRIGSLGRVLKKIYPPDEEGLVRLESFLDECEDLYFNAEDVHIEAVVLRVDRVLWEYKPEAASFPQFGGKTTRAKRPKLRVIQGKG